MKGFLLGIDIGTSSCKTVLFDLSGAVVASASREYKTIFGDAGIAEQEPQLWWEALCSTIHTICAETGIAADEILAVGLDTQSSAFIPLDAQGNVLHNALIWTDHRARDQQMWLEKNVDSARQLAINGNRFDSSNVGTKALWWKQLHPAMYEKTAVMLNASGYLVYRLTGNIPVISARQTSPNFRISRPAPGQLN